MCSYIVPLKFSAIPVIIYWMDGWMDEWVGGWMGRWVSLEYSRLIFQLVGDELGNSPPPKKSCRINLLDLGKMTKHQEGGRLI